MRIFGHDEYYMQFRYQPGGVAGLGGVGPDFGTKPVTGGVVEPGAGGSGVASVAPPQRVSRSRMFDGWQDVYVHDSVSTRSPMRFALYLPPQAETRRVPAVMWLSGLTSTEENFTVKAGAQRVAAELGLALIVPDTSPRGLNIPGDKDSWDFGEGASFYVDATEKPWSTNYRMYSYVSQELPDLVAQHFPVDTARLGISGFSMGGHGALVVALRNPERFVSVTAFSPISSPMRCPWGQKAFARYLGPDQSTWPQYDASELLRTRAWVSAPILVDQGLADAFLASQLRPELLQGAVNTTPVDLHRREGYDHSYYFVASFIGMHLLVHSSSLTA
jgi:S-formylglutathione hydrolase